MLLGIVDILKVFNCVKEGVLILLTIIGWLTIFVSSFLLIFTSASRSRAFYNFLLMKSSCEDAKHHLECHNLRVHYSFATIYYITLVTDQNNEMRERDTFSEMF